MADQADSVPLLVLSLLLASLLDADPSISQAVGNEPSACGAELMQLGHHTHNSTPLSNKLAMMFTSKSLHRQTEEERADGYVFKSMVKFGADAAAADVNVAKRRSR